MTNRVKYPFYSLLVLLFFFLWNYELVFYGGSQLKGQLHILTEAKDIKTVINDPNFPDSLKPKLILVQDIKRFAIDSIGLTTSNSYETVFNQKGKPILKIITACKPFDLEDYTWTFPVLGEVSYKGYFDEDLLNKEVQRIKSKNYDVSVGEVTAWSTLGWFKDPILTNFLRRSDGRLSNLIVHELTHGTVYVKSDVYFNENLASFIGHEGAKYFLKSKFGDSSVVYKNYLQEMKDEKIITDFVVMKSHQLDSLYQTFDPSLKRVHKNKIKKDFMLVFIDEYKQLPISTIKNYTPKIDKLNNTYFQSFRRYNLNMGFFEKEYKNFKDLRSYIQYIKETYD